MMDVKPRISLIAAVSLNGVIGRDGLLPWNIPEDLKHFRDTTLGAPVIMGRKTFQSMGRLLPGRKNIIITRQTSLSVSGAHLVQNLDSALEIAKKDLPAGKDIFVIGGGDIYKMALPVADRLYITEVDLKIDGDAYFPEWPKLRTQTLRIGDLILRFKEVSNVEKAPGDLSREPSYRFLILDRVQ
jgi:dihydrofolate reductase